MNCKKGKITPNAHFTTPSMHKQSYGSRDLPVVFIALRHIGVARIFSGVHFFPRKVDDLFSRRPQNRLKLLNEPLRPSKYSPPSKNVIKLTLALPWGTLTNFPCKLDWTGLDHLHCWRSMTWLSDNIVLHSSRSCAILVHSATQDPIQSLMSSVHRLLGRPRRFLPLIQPWRTAVHRWSALAVWPKNCNFRRWMSFSSRLRNFFSALGCRCTHCSPWLRLCCEKA